VPNINKSALVSHSAAEMFALVDDVSSYKEFLPWCGGSEELSRNEDEVNASVTISHSGLNKTFTTLNRLNIYTVFGNLNPCQKMLVKFR
jgi:ribosome-associated toxin RatA of RatAB toxin-antitoxin module